MLGEPLHQMAVVLVDAMHRKGQQHQARPGRCALTDGDIGATGWRAVPLTILTANSSFAAENAARSAGARSRMPSLMFATSSSVADDGSIA